MLGRPLSSSAWRLPVVSTLLAWGALACTTTALLNLPAATSDFAPGVGLPTPRAVQVGFINNTPFRAILTFGAYDPSDQETLPTVFSPLRLEGNSSSPQAAQPCRQAFSVGGAELIRLITENEADPSINVTDPRALIRGVNFSGAPLGDPLEAEPTEGTAEGLVLLSGVDFTCARTNIRQTTGTGLLLFTFEQDAAAPGGFRIDFTFVSP
jgi:hypothetical protein